MRQLLLFLCEIFWKWNIILLCDEQIIYNIKYLISKTITFNNIWYSRLYNSKIFDSAQCIKYDI